ncbi:class I SAM-dependent methyltransferase [Halobaculum litoreum]|uniref:Class I SAM-dependent methyltransferase n=1 Tax=Halobaculum litoreum TaxID=3031998 RepID=A0ABD5XSA0_9EURY|nr:class I SAM-dependent methyltransferase [Halobaculum sp. DT92]
MREPERHAAERAANRANWDERAAVHPETDHYDVEGFLAGDSSLHSIERERLDADGASVCHLMCHIGLDTLSWARAGATVVGVDFSPVALATARDLRDRAGIDPDAARFVEADVYDAAGTLADRFDVVVATYGVFCWLPDLDGFFETVDRLLAPGGEALFVDDHPLAAAFDGDPPAYAYPYLDPVEMEVTDGASYADPDAEFEAATTYQYHRPLSAHVTAAADAGLRVTALEEFPVCEWRRFDWLERDGEWFVQPDDDERGPDLPLSFALSVEKPASA